MSVSGPYLGRCLRGPLVAYAGQGQGGRGLVFGKELRGCVRETAVEGVRREMGAWGEFFFSFIPLEIRGSRFEGGLRFEV